MQKSEVNFKTIKENADFRIDSEYYHPEILRRLNILDHKNNDLLKNLANFTVGPFGSTVTVDKYVEGSDFRYIRNKDINDFLIADNEPAFIPEKLYESLKRFHIAEDDLLLTVVGTLGKVAIARKKDTKSIFSCKSTLLKSKEINPYYLLTYLNAPTGQIFTLRGKRGAIQEGLNLSDLKNILVYLPSRNFQNKIEELVKQAFCYVDESDKHFSYAKKNILDAVGLSNWKPRHVKTFIKTYSSTKAADRIDAEYFQPMYEEIIGVIKKYKGGFDLFGNMVTIKNKNINPNDEKNYKYIELANIHSNGVISNCTECLGSELPSRARRKVKEQDVIISSIEGSLQSIALITESWDEALCSTGFYVIDSKTINPESLMVMLHTNIGQLQLKKGCKGTILTAINSDELANIVLPKIDRKIQLEVKENITQMYRAKDMSDQLLDISKLAVEMAIEKDETEAEQWINNEIRKVKIYGK